MRRRRQPAGFEKWAWRITLVGSVWSCVGVFLEYYTQWAKPNTLLDIAFLVSIPGLLVILSGSTMLGIALLRNGLRPRTPAWLLALTIPLVVAILQVTSMGSAALPIMFAFGIFGRRIANESTYATVVPRTAAAIR